MTNKSVQNLDTGDSRFFEVQGTTEKLREIEGFEIEGNIIRNFHVRSSLF